MHEYMTQVETWLPNSIALPKCVL